MTIITVDGGAGFTSDQTGQIKVFKDIKCNNNDVNIILSSHLETTHKFYNSIPTLYRRNHIKGDFSISIDNCENGHNLVIPINGMQVPIVKFGIYVDFEEAYWSSIYHNEPDVYNPNSTAPTVVNAIPLKIYTINRDGWQMPLETTSINPHFHYADSSNEDKTVQLSKVGLEEVPHKYVGYNNNDGTYHILQGYGCSIRRAQAIRATERLRSSVTRESNWYSGRFCRTRIYVRGCIVCPNTGQLVWETIAIVYSKPLTIDGRSPTYRKQKTIPTPANSDTEAELPSIELSIARAKAMNAILGPKLSSLELINACA